MFVLYTVVLILLTMIICAEIPAITESFNSSWHNLKDTVKEKLDARKSTDKEQGNE